MVIAVNKVVLGLNYANKNIPYIRTARACPAGTPLPDGSALICKAGGLAWFVAPRSTELLTTRTAGGETNSVTCAAAVTGVSGWFVPTIGQLGNPGYSCRVNWVTCTPDVGISTNYCTTCFYASTSTFVVPGSYKVAPETYYQIKEFATGTNSCYNVNDATSLARYRTFRCITY
jgi:hypothetical protein